MRLTPVYGNDAAIDILYKLLEERPQSAWISHTKMPTRKAHARFVHRRPFAYWYLLEVDGQYVGALECNTQNELGVAVLNAHRGHAYGQEALRLFMQTHKPRVAIPAKRVGAWLANVSVHNSGSKMFFATMGFRPVQEVWRMDV